MSCSQWGDQGMACKQAMVNPSSPLAVSLLQLIRVEECVRESG